jgi:rhodanese-related sulfurtransferase
MAARVLIRRTTWPLSCSAPRPWPFPPPSCAPPPRGFVSRAVRLIKQAYTVIDVREASEFASRATVDGAANVSLGRVIVTDRAEDLLAGLGAASRVVLVCVTGVRAQMAAVYLRQVGTLPYIISYSMRLCSFSFARS